VDEKPVIIE
jgi:hypothetical protein